MIPRRALVALTFLAACAGGNDPAPIARPIETIDGCALAAAFERNAVRAGSLHPPGSRVRVTGAAGHSTSREFSPTIAMCESSSAAALYLEFINADGAATFAMQPGDPVRALCEVGVTFPGSLTLVNCRFEH